MHLGQVYLHIRNESLSRDRDTNQHDLLYTPFIFKIVSWCPVNVQRWPLILFFSIIMKPWTFYPFDVFQSLPVIIHLNADVSSLASGSLLKLATGSFWHEPDLSLITSLFSSMTNYPAPDLESLQRVPFSEKYYLETSIWIQGVFTVIGLSLLLSLFRRQKINMQILSSRC